jgi:hypothetical protein
MSVLAVIGSFGGNNTTGGTPFTVPPFNRKTFPITNYNHYTSFGVFGARHGDRIPFYMRQGDMHLVNGKWWGNEIDLTTNTLVSPTGYIIDPSGDPDHRDLWGGPTPDGFNTIFSSTTYNATAAVPWETIDIYYRKSPQNDPFNFGPEVSIWTVNPLIPRISHGRGTIYGECQDMDGKQVILLHQWNEYASTGGVSGTGPARFLTLLLTSTDSFTTNIDWKVVHDGPESFGEGTFTYLGDNKCLVLYRYDGVGPIWVYESSDGGDTWVDRGKSNLRYYDEWDVIVTQPVWHKGKLYIIYQGRSSQFIEVSRANDPAVFFGQASAYDHYLFNLPELICRNGTLSDGISTGLGYGSNRVIDTATDDFLVLFSREINSSKTEVVYSRFNMEYDDAPPDDIPEITGGFITDQRVRFDITVSGPNAYNFTSARWFIAEFAEDAAFTIHPVVKWHAILPDQAINNMRINSNWMLLQNLLPNKTYWFRMRAANLVGMSNWTTVSITTTATGAFVANTDFPLNKSQFYTSSAWNTEGLDRLVNGVENEDALDLGLFDDPEGGHEIRWLAPPEWQAVVKEVRIFAPANPSFTFPATNMNAPTEVYLIRKDTGAEVFIGNYDNAVRNVEVVLTAPSFFICHGLVLKGKNINAGQQGVGLAWGSEIKIKGDRWDVTEPTVIRARAPLSELLGADGGPWDVTTGAIAENIPSVSRILQMGLTGFRIFWPMNRVKDSATDTVAFERTMVVYDDQGGWNTDLVNEIATTRNFYIIWCWTLVTAELAAQWGGYVNVPGVRYADRDQRGNPLKHDIPSKMVFQAAARMGENTEVADVYIGVQYNHPTWGPNHPKKGQHWNVIQEPNNEKDARYAGVYGYENPKRYHAFCSATYDGHQGSLGPGYGVKAADPNMPCINAGFSLDDDNVVEVTRAFSDEARKTRGGSIPTDAFNYHHYSSNKSRIAAHKRASRSSSTTSVTIPTSHPTALTFTIGTNLKPYLQGDRFRFSNGVNYVDVDVVTYDKVTGIFHGNSAANSGSGTFASWAVAPVDPNVLHSCGMPPELSDVLDIATKMVHETDQKMNSKPVWVTEWGFDINPLSALNAKAYGSYNEEQVAAIWALRTILGYAACGIDKTTYFRYTPNFVPSPVHFDSMGLVDPIYPMYPRYYVGDFMMQLNRYKDYKFDAVIDQTGNRRVMRFKRPSDNKEIYFIWAVETETQIYENKYIILQNIGRHRPMIFRKTVEAIT